MSGSYGNLEKDDASGRRVFAHRAKAIVEDATHVSGNSRNLETAQTVNPDTRIRMKIPKPSVRALDAELCEMQNACVSCGEPAAVRIGKTKEADDPQWPTPIIAPTLNGRVKTKRRREEKEREEEEEREEQEEGAHFSELLENDEFLRSTMVECAICDPAFPYSSRISINEDKARTLGAFKQSIIVIEGTIGAGKSFFCAKLKSELKKAALPVKVIPEYVNPTLLGWFLKDPVKNAFGFQLEMLNQRIMAYDEAQRYKSNGFTVIVDRSLNGDMSFELMHYLKGSIAENQHVYYLKQLERRSRYLRVPDYCILLDVTTDTAIFNIAKRGREGEKEAYSSEYLTNLKQAYEYCMKWFDTRMLVVNYDGDERRSVPFPSADEYDEAGNLIDNFDYAFFYAVLKDLIKH